MLEINCKFQIVVVITQEVTIFFPFALLVYLAFSIAICQSGFSCVSTAGNTSLLGWLATDATSAVCIAEASSELWSGSECVAGARWYCWNMNSIRVNPVLVNAWPSLLLLMLPSSSRAQVPPQIQSSHQNQSMSSICTWSVARVLFPSTLATTVSTAAIEEPSFKFVASDSETLPIPPLVALEAFRIVSEIVSWFWVFSVSKGAAALGSQASFVGNWDWTYPKLWHLWHSGGTHSYSTSTCREPTSSRCNSTNLTKGLLALISTTLVHIQVFHNLLNSFMWRVETLKYRCIRKIC